MTLTPEGKSFLADAKRVLTLSSEIVESVRRLSRHDSAPLNIGYVANLFYDLLPVTLEAFRRAFPAVPVNLWDMSCGDQFRALEDERIDLGFVGLREPIQERGFEFRSIASYQTVAALAKDNALVGRERLLRLEDLEPFFFIGMSEASYPGYRQWLNNTCASAGFSPRVIQDAEIERTLLQCVAAGLGVALLPAQARKLPHENVVFRELKPRVLTESCIAWRTDNPSTALKAYVNIVSDRGRRMR